MKHILFAFTFSVGALALAGDVGGMDGGGGGTLPAHPVAIYQIHEIAEEAKPDLLYLLNTYEEYQSYNPQSTIYQKLFSGPQKAQDKLSGLRLEIRDDKPCLDSHGDEYDASIFGQKTDSICLSAFRISKKLDVAVAEREIIALLAHEVSHFMGADEAEAVEIQNDIAWYVLNSKSSDKLDGDAIREKLSNLISALKGATDDLQNAKTAEAYQRLLIAAFIDLQGSTRNYPYQFFGKRESDYQEILNLKLNKAIDFLVTLIPGPNQADAIMKYEKPFAGRDHFLAEEHGVYKDNLYHDSKIKKINDLSDLQNLLRQITREFELRSTYSYQATYGNQWLKVDGDLTMLPNNPWENWVGTYEVQSINCSTPSKTDSEIEFQIENVSSGLFLRRKYQNAIMSDPIRLGAYSINSYLNNYGTTADGGVTMRFESGGTWSNRMYLDPGKVEILLKRTATNQFELTKVSSYLPRKMNQPDEVRTCIYQGIVR